MENRQLPWPCSHNLLEQAPRLHLPGRQRLHAVAAGVGADFGHHGIDLAGLDVGDIHIGSVGQKVAGEKFNEELP